MPELAEQELPTANPGLRGFVTAAPLALGAPFTVLCPDFSPDHAFEIRRWQSRALTMPAVGDEVLVVLDDEQEPWAAAWWPAGGDAAITGGVEVEEWITGSTVPAGGTGSNGDLYLRTTTADVYEKVGGVWGIVANIKGATGSTGAKGETGATGATGPEGPTGGDDRGIVAALPSTSLVKGKTTCSFKAASGVYWKLLYTEEATWPWAKIGGPPLVSQYIEAALSTESETPQTTNAPAVTAPLAMQARMRWGSNLAYAINGSAQARLSLYVDTVFSNFSTSEGIATGGVVAPTIGRLTGEVASGKVVQARYARFGGTGKVEFFAPYIELDPLRVG